MTNLQTMEEIRPILLQIGKDLGRLDWNTLHEVHALIVQIRDGLQILGGRHNTTDHCIQQLKKRHAELDDRVDKLARNLDDARSSLQDKEDGLHVHR